MKYEFNFLKIVSLLMFLLLFLNCYNSEVSALGLTGTVYGNRFEPEATGGDPLEGVNVTVETTAGVYVTSNISKIGTGFFGLTVPPGPDMIIKMNILDYYEGIFTLQTGTNDNYYLNYKYGCLSDCTNLKAVSVNNVRICDASCEGINGCSFLISGFNVSEKCNGAKKNFAKNWNTSHEVECCNVNFVPKNISQGLENPIINSTLNITSIKQSTIAVVVSESDLGYKKGKTLFVELIKFQYDN